MRVYNENAISLKTMAGFLPTLLKAGIVPYIKGSPAIGKSSIAHQLAKKANLVVIDVRLAECDPTDLHGFPYFDQETKKASYFPLSTFPTTQDVKPVGTNGWLLLLDEFSNAPMAVQAAAYRLVLDREVGQHKLHDDVYIIAAGNLETDNAAAQPMSSALVSRFAIFEVNVNQKEWNEWAASAGIDYRITAYINFMPEHLYTFNPNTAEQSYASPRTWAMMHSVLKVMPNISLNEMPVLSSLVGRGVASDFLTFLELQNDLPTFEAIVANPSGIPLKKDLSILWALMGMVSHKVSETTLDQVLVFVKRFTDDLQVVAMREIIQRHPELKNKPSFNTWINELSKVFK